MTEILGVEFTENHYVVSRETHATSSDYEIVEINNVFDRLKYADYRSKAKLLDVCRRKDLDTITTEILVLAIENYKLQLTK